MGVEKRGVGKDAAALDFHIEAAIGVKRTPSDSN